MYFHLLNIRTIPHTCCPQGGQILKTCGRFACIPRTVSRGRRKKEQAAFSSRCASKPTPLRMYARLLMTCHPMYETHSTQRRTPLTCYTTKLTSFQFQVACPLDRTKRPGAALKGFQSTGRICRTSTPPGRLFSDEENRHQDCSVRVVVGHNNAFVRSPQPGSKQNEARISAWSMKNVNSTVHQA